MLAAHRPMVTVMKCATAGTARRRRWVGTAAVLTVLTVGGLAAGGAALAVRRGQQHLAIQTMDTYRTNVADAITDEVDHYADTLADIAVAIATQPALTDTQFQAMTAQLNITRLPGASVINFVVPSSDRAVPATQALWRARGSTGLSLYRTSPAAEHAFIVLNRALTGAAPARGRDLNEVGETAETLRIARETASFTVGDAHILLRDRTLPVAQQQMSFNLAMPVLGPPTAAGAVNLRGWVTMGVRGGDFLSSTLASQAQSAVQVSLNDPQDGTAKPIAQVTPAPAMDSPDLVRTQTVEVGHHTWRLVVRPTTRLLSTSDRWASELILLGGLAVTLLLGVLVAVLAGARSKAMDLVDQATAALREDIRRREEVEAELHILAFTDQLTGLANRGLFYDRVGHALSSHLRSGDTFAVFFIDLDGFKQVNDELGHGAGDVVLQQVAARLRRCLRDGDTVARFGGDEFAVIAERVTDPSAIHVTAERIVAAVREPIEVGGLTRPAVTASVGVALNRPGDSADDILREADLAMYTAKTTGKSRHVLAGESKGPV